MIKIFIRSYKNTSKKYSTWCLWIWYTYSLCFKQYWWKNRICRIKSSKNKNCYTVGNGWGRYYINKNYKIIKDQDAVTETYNIKGKVKNSQSSASVTPIDGTPVDPNY